MNDIDMSVKLVNAAQARWRAYGVAAEKAKRQKRKDLVNRVKTFVWQAGVVITAGAFWLVFLGGLATLYKIIWR